MKRACTCLSLFVLLLGCASSSRQKAGGTTTPAESEPSAWSRLDEQSAQQAERIAELEARLGLLEQEARGYRDSTPRKPVETVRIGAHRSRADDDEEQLPRTTAVLRLHEEEPLPAEPLSLPAPPTGVSARLGVVPLPEDRARGLAAESSSSDPREQYREALRLLQARRWDESRAALKGILDQYPGHDLADDAQHWRGEAFYAERRYAEALAEFRVVIDRFPSSNKSADALLKAGMCQKRLGAGSEAARYFQRLRDRFPDSEAARIASREGSS